jgi:transposase InsO family protein
VVWSGDWPTDPGDEEILARALAEARVLVTLDKDFGEMAIVREIPHAGILRLGFHAARETFRRILIRRRDLVGALQQARRRRPRRISASRPLDLWGADLTLLFVLGFLPVWILGVVDYRGSRLVAFEPLPWPTAAAIARVLGAAMDRHGAPSRLLTDRGPVFRAQAVADLLAAHGVRHVLTRPAHPWINGRIERVFRLFKETVFSRFWLIASRRQLGRFCTDFLLWHNRDRPHGGQAPPEVRERGGGRAILALP